MRPRRLERGAGAGEPSLRRRTATRVAVATVLILAVAVAAGAQMKRQFITHRIVAHALGGIDGHTYTNSLEGFQRAYRMGVRTFEVDFRFSADGRLLAFHDPTMKDKFGLDAPVGTLTRAQFLGLRVYGRYTPMDLAAVLDLLARYPDIRVVTDTKCDGDGCGQFFEALVHAVEARDPHLLTRIVPQVYHEDDLADLRRLARFDHVIYTLYRTRADDEQVFATVAANREIREVTMDRDRFSRPLAHRLAGIGVKVYVHTINRPMEMLAYLRQGVFGFYSDLP